MWYCGITIIVQQMVVNLQLSSVYVIYTVAPCTWYVRLTTANGVPVGERSTL